MGRITDADLERRTMALARRSGVFTPIDERRLTVGTQSKIKGWLKANELEANTVAQIKLVNGNLVATCFKRDAEGKLVLNGETIEMYDKILKNPTFEFIHSDSLDEVEVW